MKKCNLLIDTNIVLYAMEWRISSKEILKFSSLFLSEISEMELLWYSKITDNERTKISNFLEYTRIIRFDSAIKKIAIWFMVKYNISLADAIILWSASHYNIPLVTADKKLKRVNEVNVVLFRVNAV